MNNFKRMHLIAGAVSMILLIWLFPKWSVALIDDWKQGIGFTAKLGLCGYLIGCVVGLFVNLLISILVERKN